MVQTGFDDSILVPGRSRAGRGVNLRAAGVLWVLLTATPAAALLLAWNPSQWVWGLALLAAYAVVLLALARWLFVKPLREGLGRRRLQRDMAVAASDAARAQLRAVLENMDDGFFILGSDWRVEYANPRAVELMEAAGPVHPGVGFWELVPDEKAAPGRAERCRAEVAAGRHCSLEDFHELHERWLELRVFPTGLGIGALVRDVTLRHHLLAELHERERRYRELFEANPNMMWIYDARTLRFLAVNDAAISQYGYSREEFLSMRLTDIRPMDDRGGLGSALEEEEGMAFLGDAPRIWRHEAKNGRPILAEVTRHPIVFQGCAALLAMVADVTARLASESRLRDRQSRMARQLGDATRSAAVHERIARGLLQTATLCEHLRQRTSRLLELQRGDVPSRTRMDLSEMAHAEITQLRLRDPQRRVHVEIEPGLVCEGDAVQVRELVRELLGNAWAFTRDRVHAWIRIGRSEDSPERFFVSDNGCGFEDAVQGQLFLPFERSHAEGVHAGHGLGLALARAVAERHGGRVWAESRRGQGSTFFFELAPPSGDAAPLVQEVVIDSAVPVD